MCKQLHVNLNVAGTLFALLFRELHRGATSHSNWSQSMLRVDSRAVDLNTASAVVYFAGAAVMAVTR